MAKIIVESNDESFIFERKFNSEDIYDMNEWLLDQLNEAVTNDEKKGTDGLGV